MDGDISEGKKKNRAEKYEFQNDGKVN